MLLGMPINSNGILLNWPHKLRWRLNMIIVTGQLATTINFHSTQTSGWFLILFIGCKVMTFIYDLSSSCNFGMSLVEMGCKWNITIRTMKCQVAL